MFKIKYLTFCAASFTITFEFLGKILLIFFLIYIITELTPKIAAKIDQLREKSEKNKEPEDQRLYSVRSAFEPHDDDPEPDKTFLSEKKNSDNK